MNRTARWLAVFPRMVSTSSMAALPWAAVALGAVLALGAPACAIGDEPAFLFNKEVRSPALKQEELLAVTLDADVFAATRDELPDVRLLDDERNPIPYVLRQVRTTRKRTVRHTWTAHDPSARPLADGSLEITIALEDEDPRPNGLSLITPLRNFEHRVRVQTSADGRQWEPAGSEAVIFDYSRYMDVRSHSVSFPKEPDSQSPAPNRHFRILVDDVTAEQESELLELTRSLRGGEETGRQERVIVDRRPFRIERIEFWRETEQKRATGDEKTDYPVIGFRVAQDAEKQQTVIHVVSGREPLTSLELVTPSRNFSRHAVVEIEEAAGVRRTWRKIGEATLSRVDFKTLKREQLSIVFPETREEQYRIVIDNRDNRPLEVTGIHAEGNVYELLCLAAPAKRYQLVYGSRDAEPADYDTAAVRQLLQEGFSPTRAELGEQLSDESAGRPAAFRWRELLGDPRFLVTVIALLVIVLGWVLYHAARRMDTVPSGQTSGEGGRLSGGLSNSESSSPSGGETGGHKTDPDDTPSEPK